MNNEQTIRAWKDEDYRLSLSETELSALPQHPAGLIELSDLDVVRGGDDEAITPTVVILVGSIIITVPVVTVIVSITLKPKTSPAG